MAGIRQPIKRKRRKLMKPDRVISLLNLPKIVSVDGEINTKSILPPPPPNNLNAVAKGEWVVMIKELCALGRFEQIDRTALAMYCETYAEWYEAGIALKKPGQTLMLKNHAGKTIYRNPWADTRARARRDMATFLALFGMSPHDRARLGMDERGGAGHPKKEPNEFSEF